MPPSCRPSRTSRCMILLLFCSLWSLSWRATAFTTLSLPHTPSSRILAAPALGVVNLRDADFAEMMMGGERYEMVPLPDSMVETTLFVGNLNEFVNDDDLSNLFQTVSTLQSLPACVCRRPNWDSLKYGFVTFPTVEEKVVRTKQIRHTKTRKSLCGIQGMNDLALILFLFLSFYYILLGRHFEISRNDLGREKNQGGRDLQPSKQDCSRPCSRDHGRLC